MFSKKQRFSFNNKLAKNILNSQSFTLRYGSSDGGLKVAVVVSKKVDKKATARNKIKRKFTEAIKKNIDIQYPLSLVFFIKRAVSEQTLVEKEIEEVINKIKHV